jgi:hypothetical protein
MRRRLAADGAHPSWRKLFLIESVLTDNMDLGEIVLWVDADTCVTNFEKEIPLLKGESCIGVSRDWDNNSPWSTGVMLIRECGEAMAIFREAGVKTHWMNRPLWDQGALQEVWRAREESFLIFPRRTLQSVPSSAGNVAEPWQPMDWVCHATNVPNKLEEVKSIMRKSLLLAND